MHRTEIKSTIFIVYGGRRQRRRDAPATAGGFRAGTGKPDPENPTLILDIRASSLSA